MIFKQLLLILPFFIFIFVPAIISAWVFDNETFGVIWAICSFFSIFIGLFLYFGIKKRKRWKERGIK